MDCPQCHRMLDEQLSYSRGLGKYFTIYTCSICHFVDARFKGTTIDACMEDEHGTTEIPMEGE